MYNANTTVHIQRTPYIRWLHAKQTCHRYSGKQFNFHNDSPGSAGLGRHLRTVHFACFVYTVYSVVVRIAHMYGHRMPVSYSRSNPIVDVPLGKVLHSTWTLGENYYITVEVPPVVLLYSGMIPPPPPDYVHAQWPAHLVWRTSLWVGNFCPGLLNVMFVS